jgi:hypothetical protein
MFRSPQNEKELYNLRHSSCRNIIERSFGIVKSRYKVRSYRSAVVDRERTFSARDIDVHRHIRNLPSPLVRYRLL